MTNKKILKNLLATASTLAVLASGPSAFAATIVTGGPETLGAVGTWVGGAAPVNGDNIQIGAAGHTVNFNVAAIRLGTVDVNSLGSVITVTNSASIGNVINTGMGGNAQATFNLVAGQALTFAGTNYTALTADKLVVDFKNQANTSAVFATDGTTFTGTFQSTGGNNGVVNVNGNTTFNNVATKAIAGNNMDHFVVATGKKLTLTGTTDLSNTANALVVDGTGELEVGTGTNSGAVSVVAGGKVHVTGTTGVVTLGNAASTVNLMTGGVATIDATANTNGVVNVMGNGTITQLGATNAVASVVFNGDNTLTLGNGAAHTAKAITTLKNNEGTIALGNNLTVDTIGTKNERLKSIAVAVGQTLEVTGNEFHIDVTGTGKVSFAGALTVDGALGNNSNKLALVTVSGANAKVVFADSLKNVNELKFDHANAEASLTSVGIDNMNIDAANAGNGKLTLNNDADIKFAAIGTTNALGTLKLSGKGNVEVTGVAKVQNLQFTSGTRLIVDKTDNLGAGGAITTETATSGGVIAFKNAASALAVDLGAKDKSLKELRYIGTGAATINLAGKNLFGANVVSDKEDVLTVADVGSAAADTIYAGFGEEKARLASLAFVATGGKTTTVNGDIYSNAITTAGGAKLALNSVYGKDSKSVFTLRGGDNITFADGAILKDMALDAFAIGNGDVTFAGSATVGLLGSTKALNSVTFSDKTGAVRDLGDDIQSNTLVFGEGTYNFQKDQIRLTATGMTTNAKSVLNLGNNSVGVDADLTAAGATQVKMGKTSKFDMDANNLVNPENVTFVIPDVVASGFTMTDAISANGLGALFKAATGKMPTVVSGNRLNKWSATQGTTANDATLVASTDVGAFKSDLASAKASNAVLNFITDMVADSDKLSGQAEQLLNFMASADTLIVKSSEAAGRVIATAPSTAAMTFANTSLASAVVDQRAAAVAAGDEDASLNVGVWAQGFGAKATQKARKGDSGYKATTTGGTIGVDTMVSEHTMLGLAATYSATDVKFKDIKSGDKAKTKNMFFNLYGRQNLANNWFVQGGVGFGSGNVKANSNRVISNTAYDTAQAKYDTMAFSLEALAGYNLRMADSAVLVPAAGIRYLNVNEGGYSEKGSAYNRTVTKKAYDKITGIVGAAVQGNAEMNGMVLAPEAHAYVNYDFKSKNPKVEAKLDGWAKTFDVSAAKQAKASYNVGTSVTAKSGMVEYGVGYDAKLSNKFVSHQGSVRVKVDL